MLQAEEIHVDRWEIFTMVDFQGQNYKKKIAKFTRVKGHWMMHVDAGIWFPLGTMRELTDLLSKLTAKGTLKNGARV